MKLSEIKNQLNSFLDGLQKNDLLLDRNDSIIFSTGIPNVQMLSWKKTAGLSQYYDETVKIEEYLNHLRNRNYQVVLYDGALIQITYKFKRHNLINHRLTYYPCPIKFEREDLVEMPLDEIVELHCMETININMLSPLRFDYDPDSAKEYHPTSHLHMSKESCRVPIQSPLSLGHFLRFIFLNFYSDIWDKHAFIRDVPLGYFKNCLSEFDQQLMHFKWVD